MTDGNKKTRKNKEVEVERTTIEQIKNIFTEQFKTHEENISNYIFQYENSVRSNGPTYA